MDPFNKERTGGGEKTFSAGDHAGAVFTPLALDWESFLFSYRLPRMSSIEVTSANPDRPVQARTVEDNLLGRLAIQGLAPATAYEVDVRWDGGTERLAFETLPAPVGPLKSHYMAMADPHVSLKPENRKGRLFIESASILRDLVEACNRLHVDGVLAAGDITNAGTAPEFDLARDIFSGLHCPLYAAPGDHDIRKGDASLWTSAFGEPARASDMKGLRIVLLNTSSKSLGATDRPLIEEALNSPARGLLMVTHLQLVPDAHIRYVHPKRIENGDAHEDLLDRLRRRGALVYVGHQNVPSRVQEGGLQQINLPQPVQFPCGCLRVREYENGFYHTFFPISSEALNEHSRLVCQAAVGHYNEPQWVESYRLGPGFDHLNFLVPLASGKRLPEG